MAKAPSIKSSPWAKLMISMTPKISRQADGDQRVDQAQQ